MPLILDAPLLILVFSLVILYFSGWIGDFFRKRRRRQEGAAHEDFNLIMAATLTLLSLIIGFTFSMAVSRYDQRKNYEEAEANAIGTEYLRLDLMPEADMAKGQSLLRRYLDQRILFYETRDDKKRQQIDITTARLEADLWSAIQVPAMQQPTPVLALVVSGMNDVLNSQGYTQAAWWNRIPTAAWALMAVIAVFCNLLVGYGMHRTETKKAMLLILPIVVSIAFFLIADIDSPLGGAIHVQAKNLDSVAQSLTSVNDSGR
jgi:hypothetical protein